MLQEESMTDALRSLAAELDELGREGACPHAPVAEAEDSRPPDVPDFRIADVLGSGGMGTVYIAEQISLGREVALKVVGTMVGTSVRGHAGRVTLPDEARTAIADRQHL